jgi:oxygen-independent coproporphyrinogen-3 oxidase
LVDRFLQAIDEELAGLSQPSVRTVFVGGGTPTHLDVDQLGRLLSLIRKRFDFEDECEWSIEANPEDINDEKLDVLTEHGVNRVSLGVQSFDNRKLQTLERAHFGESAAATVKAVCRRIANVSLDLIFAAPGETIEAWRQDLETALSLPISHLSTYALTFEKGTSFWSRRNRGELESLGESLEVEMYELARAMTARTGLGHYEISNFARQGFQCRHNLSYWEGRGWYAAGPGAARFVVGRREVNHRSTTTYLRRMESEQDPTAESEPIGIKQYARELAAFGIRMLAGIDVSTLSTATGVDIALTCGDAIKQSVEDGLLLKEGDHLRLTERGILFADTVASRFLG